MTTLDEAEVARVREFYKRNRVYEALFEETIRALRDDDCEAIRSLQEFVKDPPAELVEMAMAGAVAGYLDPVRHMEDAVNEPVYAFPNKCAEPHERRSEICYRIMTDMKLESRAEAVCSSFASRSMTREIK